MWQLFLTILRRDLMLALRRKSDLAQVIFFFAVVVTLVPLGVGAETNTLRAIAPGVVWVAALLAALLSLPRMFAADFADGTLEQNPFPSSFLRRSSRTGSSRACR